MGKNARLAHTRQLCNRTNGHAFKPDVSRKIESSFYNRGFGLLPFWQCLSPCFDSASLYSLGAIHLLRARRSFDRLGSQL